MSRVTAKQKADALLIAGDALAKVLPARSKALLRECRMWRERQEIEERAADSESKRSR